MQNSRWLRYGLASLTLFGAGISALVVACSSDSTDDTADDGGTQADTGTVTTGDGGTDTDTGITPAIVPAKLQLVNAATDLGDGVDATRICYKIGETADALIWAPGLPPLPNRVTDASQPFPGVFGGTGGPVASAGTIDYGTLIIRPFVFSAYALAVKANDGKNVVAPNDIPCGSLIDADAGGTLTAGVDYWQLPDIPLGTFLQHNSYILALTGCSANSQIGEAAAANEGTPNPCGEDWTNGTVNGNLKVNIFQVDNSTVVDTSSLGAQFIQLSPFLDTAIKVGTENSETKARPAFLDSAGDSISAKYLAGDGGAGTADVEYQSSTDLVQVGGVDLTAGKFTANPNVAELAVAITNIEALSFGRTTAGAPNAAYANGSAYTFISLGDLSPATSPDGGASGATFNTRYFHYIALPNDPTIPQYDSTK